LLGCRKGNSTVTEATDAPRPTRDATPVKRRRWGWVVVAIMILAAGTITAALIHAKGRLTSPDSTPGVSAESVPPILVETVHLSKGGITRTSTQIGSVHPYEEADLYAKVSGYLEKLYVNYGDRVKHDQVLAEIFDPEVVADAEKATADVRQAKAAVKQAEAFIEAAKADRDATASAVDQAMAEIDRYRSMTTYHEKKYERYKRLVVSKAIPQEIADEEEESYESSKANELAARKGVLKAKADLIAANARVKKAEADLDEAKANISIAEAKQDRAEALLGYLKIRSPYDGVVTRRNFFRGAFIRSAVEGGTLPLLTVARTDMVYVVTAVPDRDVPLTDVGEPAEITLDALGNEVFKGKVSRIAEAEDPTSRTMHTEIDLPNPQNRLRPGMYGIAKIFLHTSTKSSTLPASCIVGESKGGTGEVYVIKNGKAKKTRVEVGSDDGIRVEILSGLSPDDEVILNTGSVTDGVPVRSIRVSDPKEAPSHP
jgi:HlyD family secretion protein